MGKASNIYSEITLGCCLSFSRTRHTLFASTFPFHPPWSDYASPPKLIQAYLIFQFISPFSLIQNIARIHSLPIWQYFIV